MYFPALHTVAADESDTVERTAAADGLRIMVMDDDETIREVVSQMLIGCGYGVETAEDGQSAIEMQGLRDLPLQAILSKKAMM